jgi:hypothetical protein
MHHPERMKQEKGAALLLNASAFFDMTDLIQKVRRFLLKSSHPQPSDEGLGFDGAVRVMTGKDPPTFFRYRIMTEQLRTLNPFPVAEPPHP